MAERSDHLIERAAALLGAAKAGTMSPPGQGSVPGPTPQLSAAPGPLSPAPGAIPRLFVPPKSPVPGIVGFPGAPAQRPTSRPEVTSAAEARGAFADPPLGIDVLERAGLIVARNKRTRTAEEYRIVIGRVLRALHEEPEEGVPGAEDAADNVVMITSARPGEGKSFTALNLAGSIAQNAGESVVLVDVDPKVRGMTDQLGLGEKRGFLDVVANPDISVDELLIATDVANLSVLPLGTRGLHENNGPESLPGTGPSRRVTPAILRIAARYPKSLIVLDSPPCLSTSDPHTIAPVVGQVVMIVEAERTQRNEVEAALDLVRVCPTITMLLNKVKMKTSHTFGAYDYFGSYT